VFAWTAAVALAGLHLVDLILGLRVPEEEEREGLDLASHGERAYDLQWRGLAPPGLLYVCCDLESARSAPCVTEFNGRTGACRHTPEAEALLCCDAYPFSP
jgi:ammonium transporter family